MYLYIPIWFYSNLFRKIIITTKEYIYIQILFYKNYWNRNIIFPNYLLYIPIWFYSNGSQASELSLLEKLYIPIWFYSNCIPRSPFTPFINFTFQSGSIQINIRFAQLGNFTFFTFQSGSIQIKLRLSRNIKKGYLYIPIWFYSNIDRTFISEVGTDLYIPIWFYSNKGAFCYVNEKINFTFQSGSIQITNRTPIK